MYFVRPWGMGVNRLKYPAVVMQGATASQTVILNSRQKLKFEEGEKFRLEICHNQLEAAAAEINF